MRQASGGYRELPSGLWGSARQQRWCPASFPGCRKWEGSQQAAGGHQEDTAGARLNGHPEYRLPNTVNVTLPGFRGESMVMAMDQLGVFFSSGSHAARALPIPAMPFLAMGLSEADAHCALRFSLGYANTEEEIDHTLDLLGRVITESRAMVHFVPCR